METPSRRTFEWVHLAYHIAAIFFVIFVGVWVIWQVASKPNAKLFEEDNVVCYSQPYAIECHPHTK